LEIRESLRKAKKAIILNKSGLLSLYGAVVVNTLAGSAMAQNTMGDINNNQGIVTQGQNGNNTIIQRPPGRSMSQAAAEKIAASLRSSNIHGRIEVMTDMMACPDCDRFAKQIEAALGAASNITVVPMRNGMSMRGFQGVAIGVRDPTAVPQSVQAVVAAFNSIGGQLTVIQSAPDDPACDGVIIVAQPTG
jgi:hypothetical protein